MIENMVKLKDKLLRTAQNGLAAAEIKLGLKRHQALVNRIKLLERENKGLRERMEFVRKQVDSLHAELSKND